MKHSPRLAAICGVTILFVGAIPAGASQQARVTQVVQQVSAGADAESMHPVAVNELLPEATILRTGPDSRAEVTFLDQTVVRLSTNTTFSFRNGSRSLNVTAGSVLVQAPRHLLSSRIEVPQVGAVVSGTTAVFENHGNVFKLMVLQGTGRVYRPGHFGESILVRPGQLLIGQPGAALTDPVDFDVGRFVDTCRLIKDFAPLRTERSVAQVRRLQQKQKAQKHLIETNLVIFGAGTAVTLTKPAPADANDSPDAGTQATPPPPPGSQTMPHLERAKDVPR